MENNFLHNHHQLDSTHSVSNHRVELMDTFVYVAPYMKSGGVLMAELTHDEQQPKKTLNSFVTVWHTNRRSLYGVVSQPLRFCQLANFCLHILTCYWWCSDRETSFQT